MKLLIATFAVLFSLSTFASPVELTQDVKSFIIDGMIDNEETRSLYLPNSNIHLSDVLLTEKIKWQAGQKNLFKFKCENFIKDPLVSCVLAYTDPVKKISYGIFASVNFLDAEQNNQVNFVEISYIDVKFAEFD